MRELNLTLLERLGQLAAEQHLTAKALLELQRGVAIADEPMQQAKTASVNYFANWSRIGLNLRLPQIDPLP